MSFLDSVKQGHVLSGNGMYELPSAEEVVTKIKKIYYRIKKNSVMIQNIEN